MRFLILYGLLRLFDKEEARKFAEDMDRKAQRLERWRRKWEDELEQLVESKPTFGLPSSGIQGTDLNNRIKRWF